MGSVIQASKKAACGGVLGDHWWLLRCCVLERLGVIHNHASWVTGNSLWLKTWLGAVVLIYEINNQLLLNWEIQWHHIFRETNTVVVG